MNGITQSANCCCHRIVVACHNDLSNLILNTDHWKKKSSHFDLRSWVTWGTKIRLGIPSNWRIFESNWLNIESQIESTLRVKLNQHWESNWINIESQIDSILRVNLNWLNIESQFELTLNIKTIWLKYSPITRNPGSNFSSASDSTF